MTIALFALAANAASSVYWEGEAYDTTKRNATLMGVNGSNQEIWAVAPTGETAAYIKIYVDGVKFDSRHSWFEASKDYKYTPGSIVNTYVRNNRGVVSNYSFVRLESSSAIYISWKSTEKANDGYLKDLSANIEVGEVKCESYRGGIEVPLTISYAGINPIAIQKVEVLRNGEVIKTYNYAVANGFSNATNSESFVDNITPGATEANYQVVVTPIDALKVLVNGGAISASKNVELPETTPVAVKDVYLEKQVDDYAWGGWRANVEWDAINYSDIASVTLLRNIELVSNQMIKSVHVDVNDTEEVTTIYDLTQTSYLDKFNNEELASNDFILTYTIRLNFTDGTSEEVESSAYTENVEAENPIHTGVGAVKVDENESKTIYTVDGVKVSQTEIANLPAGTYIVRAGKKVEKIQVK